MKNDYIPKVVNEDCKKFLQISLSNPDIEFDLTFYDPPFNQKKQYNNHNDDMPENEYWSWMKDILTLIYKKTSRGGGIYFMQREKNTDKVMETLKKAGWNYQNLIIWKKMTSAVPSKTKYGLNYQIIVYCIKGEKPRVFNKLRNDPILNLNHKGKRKKGAFITDVWDDVRELTSGYFAGEEPLKTREGDRLHKQQSPIHLLLRIILSSSKPGDLIFDPFAGTGTTGIVSTQINRNSLCIELDPINYNAITDRFQKVRKPDLVCQYINLYSHTDKIKEIIGSCNCELIKPKEQITFFEVKKVTKELLEIINKSKTNPKISKKTQEILSALDMNYNTTDSITLDE
ncbi:MAG: site-specific DNA-methyltransferase [Candidatus Heimdallarchaeota archaeon]|nr:site-specific DNA-methyltransferase [Candidatus Heimdallarchaeota archaeon]MDH5644857.1 site-specific DNA-methyltransferase [Candidatus Heimdallarchaeota archaeon]